MPDAARDRPFNIFGMAGIFGMANRAAAALKDAFDTADGRWAMISTAVTASGTGAIALLALAASPPGAAAVYEPRRIQAALPYDLLLELPGARALPGIATEDYRMAGFVAPGRTFPSGSVRRGTAGLIGPFDSALAQELALSGAPGTQTRMLTVENGGTIMGMLEDAGIPARDAVAVVDAIRPVYSPRSIRAGQEFEANFGLADYAAENSSRDILSGPTPLRLLSLSFSPSIERQITVQQTAPGEYSVDDVLRELAAQHQHAGAMIDSSLYLAAMEAGIPAAIVVEMIHMFSYDVDFQRDVHPGDQFEVFFDYLFTADGEPARTGDIMTATMVLGGKRHTLYRFITPDGDEYFDTEGNSARSLLMKTPVDGARISSSFGARRHPILGYTRMHQGIDFAVPSGTPVMAAGNGTVSFAGRNGGYGNFVLVTHSNGYSTAYAHLSRFAAGIRKGARVRQGQAVGYAGMTGLATGPHLHYEIRLNNAQVNPTTVKVAAGRKLEGSELETFLAERDRIVQLAAGAPMQTQVAQASGLRSTGN